jgi:HSP20 family protein
MIRIRRIDPSDAPALHRRMEQVVESLLHGLGPGASAGGFLPRADVHETADGLLVTLDLGGVRREDLEIQIEGPFLRVAGARREPDLAACTRWHQMEIAYGPFERVFALPPEADTEAITAGYRDGFLEITIPRRAGSSRQVPIETT